MKYFSNNKYHLYIGSRRGVLQYAPTVRFAVDGFLGSETNILHQPSSFEVSL
jgi:hypothetical protein